MTVTDIGAYSNSMTVAKSMPLPDRLRTLRLERGYSQTELGDRAGVGQTAISQFERGEAKPSIITLYKLAESLHVTVAALLEDPA